VCVDNVDEHGITCHHPEMSRLPLVQAIAELRRARTPGTVALYIAIGVVMLLLLSVPVSTSMQNQLVRAHHARPSSVPRWVVFQIVPKMYSFAHRVWFSPEPLTEFLVTRPDDVPHEMQWVNHYPIRAARFESARDEIVRHGEDVHVLVQTGYRGRTWFSRYVVHVDGNALVLEPQ
jgi:hypothetical protein